MNALSPFRYCLVPLTCCLLLAGCHGPLGPQFDRPFPVGQVTDAFWETQETNAEAAKFTFYQHEFVGETAHLNPAGKKKLLQVALRIPHVPFPIVVEQSENNRYPERDEKRRLAIVEYLTRLGVNMIDDRVVVAPAFVPGLSAIEGEQAYRAQFSGGFRGYGGGGYGGGYR